MMAGIRRQRPNAGFTLVELLVAMAITSILSIAIYGMFDTTSTALYEADSLADTVDVSRFAVERLRSDIKNAGSFGTPDSAEDRCSQGIPPCVKPAPLSTSATDIRVAGLVSYGGGNGWQDYASSVMPGDVYSANSGSSRAAEFDGIVVIGAYDFPMSFEIGALSNTAMRGLVFQNQRGLYKLVRNDPFDTALGPPSGANFGNASTYDPMTNLAQFRILRVMDGNGYLQFTGMNGASHSTGADCVTANCLRVDFDHQLYFQQNNERYGLDQETQQKDKAYPAAFLDVFWYHVIQDPNDPHNFQLVRERLDGSEVMDDLTNSWGSFDPSSARAWSSSQGRYVVIANRVADFQIWFDCAATSECFIEQVDWNAGWSTPDGTDTPSGSAKSYNGCLNPSDPHPGEARIAHIRLSLHTANERPDLKHDASDPFRTAIASGGSNFELETFDKNPDFEGATRVHTTQVDFELPNFVARNITP